MLREQQCTSGDGSRRESCEEQQQMRKREIGLIVREWPGSDEVTLGGSERAESEKDGSARSSRGL
jgi:hypothetical protein